MEDSPSNRERLHSLDSLRGIMMMLGILLHSAPAYMGGEPGIGLPLRDPNASNHFFEWIYSIIHIFRMPIFMIVAGFFAALLFYDRSPKKMIKNRINRILYPFILFVIILWPFIILGFSYSNGIFSFTNTYEGRISELFISTTPSYFSKISSFIPKFTFHLWFLYYLIMFSLASFVLGFLFKRVPLTTHKIKVTFNLILQKPILKLTFFPSITFLLLISFGKTWVGTSTSFIPQIETFIFYFLFYMIGWVLFKSKHLLSTFMTFDWQFVITGTLLYSIFFTLDSSDFSTHTITLINVICLWLFVFGIIGLFLRYFSNHSERMRYISDSSYWIYLIHLPLISFLPGLIGSWNLYPFVKFSIVLLSTLIICFVTYHYLVRSTFIGEFLNGSKYSLKKSKKKTVLLFKPKPV